MTRHVRFVALVLGAILIFGIAAAPAAASECGCVQECYSPGYWKNHPEAWPVGSITVGGVSYTKSEAIALMNMQGGDKSITLFKAVVAAKLNILIGCPYCCTVEGALGSADYWLSQNPAGSGVQGSSSAWRCGERFYCILDTWYNTY